jgi:hypothetical protein
MTICKRCDSIPLYSNGLPTLPAELWGFRTSWRYIHTFERTSGDEEFIGYPYHPSLESLKSSAQTCSLCHLVLNSIEKAIEELRNPDKEDFDLPKPPTWELWLTKRQELGDGFCVFTNSMDRGEFSLVAAVGICVEEGIGLTAPRYMLFRLIDRLDDPLSSIYPGRPIEDHSASPKTMEIIKKWVKKYDENSSNVAESPLLPSRIIDVGDTVDGYLVRLQEVEGKEKQYGKYIALSHCWGTGVHFMTTRESLAASKIGINYEKLPKSFHDAITITRILGIRYIWIDSICICQDDGEDWERESSKMTSIYRNS